MAKAISGASFNLLRQETGTEPLLLIQVNFGAGLSYYCERELLEDEGGPCKGKVISISEFSFRKKADNFGASGNITLTLDDVDGEIKFAYDNTTLEQKPIAVYIYYPGTGLFDAVPLLIGRITGPISWSEGQRVVTFGVETEVQGVDLGFAPTPDDIEDLSPEAYQVPWPIIFGKCAHVPTVKIKNKTRGFLKTDARLKSEIYKVQPNGKILTFSDKCWVESYVRQEDDTLTSVKDKLYIEGGENFPRNKEIKIIVDNIVFEGSFNSDDDPSLFSVKTSNVAKYPKIQVGAREKAESTDDEYRVLWLADEKYQIAGMHCYFKPDNGHEWENLCVRQVGKKCYFANRFLNPVTGAPIKMDGKYSMAVYGTFKSGLHKDRYDQDVTTFLGFVNKATGAVDRKGLMSWAKDHLKRIAGTGSAFTEFAANEEVRLVSENDPEVYVASLIKCETIHGVYGKKSIKFGDGKTRQMFVPIPKNWYSVVNTDYRNGTGPATTLHFNVPLLDRNNEGTAWDDTVYVTATSTVGPNIVDAIEWILEKHTDLRVDKFSFNEAKGHSENTPAHFVLNNQEDALRVAEDLAWQARCVLIVDSGIAYLKYLPVIPNPVMTFTNDNIQLKSIEEGFTDLNEVKTKLIVNWYESFKDAPNPSRLTGSQLEQFEMILRQIVPEFNRKIEGLKLYNYRNNTSQFGVLQEERQVRIYNDEKSVAKTANFWGGRYSNIWKTITFKTFLDALILQPFDCVQIITTGKSAYSTYAIIEDLSYSHESKDVTIKAWLPIKAGTVTQAREAWPNE